MPERSVVGIPEYSPAAKVEPRYTFPSMITAPPVPVPNTMTVPLETPCMLPFQISAAAAAFASFSTAKSTGIISCSLSFKFTPLM